MLGTYNPTILAPIIFKLSAIECEIPRANCFGVCKQSKKESNEN